MRNGIMRHALALLTAFAMLIAMCGYAEEMEQPAGMEASMDEVLVAEESGEAEATPRDLAILLYNPPSATINFAESISLAAAAPAGANVAWTSSDENVAELHANGDGSVTVVGVGEGTATIVCTLDDQTQTYSVTVNPPQTLLMSDVEYPSTLRISGRGWGLGRGAIASIDDLKTLTSAIKNASGEMIAQPYTQTFEGGVKSFKIRGIDRYVPFGSITEAGQYIWMLTATDASGRSVTVNLPIQAVADGETVVSRAAAKCAPVIRVPDAPDGGNAIALQAGEKKGLTATQLPGDAGNGVIWVSYDPAVATVSPEGEITGVGAGSTTVICRTLDNTGFSAGCTVTVNAAAPANDAGNQPQGDGRNYLAGTATPKTASMDTPSTPNNFQTTDPYSTPGKKKLGELGFTANDQATISFDWQISQNGELPYTYGNFRAEWVGWKDGKDNQYIAAIMNPIAAFSENDTSGHAVITVGLTDAILQAHTLRLRIDNSVLNLTISNCKLERGGVATQWSPAPEDAAPAN